MAYDSNIPRWFKASVAKHISDTVKDCKLYLNSYSGDDQVWAELRVDGPTSENYEYASWQFDFSVSLLITAFCGSDDYLIDRLVGAFGTALDQDICVYKYGDGLEDDGSQFTVLQQYPADAHKVDIIHFGLVAAESKFKRAMVESSYTAWL